MSCLGAEDTGEEPKCRHRDKAFALERFISTKEQKISQTVHQAEVQVQQTKIYRTMGKVQNTKVQKHRGVAQYRSTQDHAKPNNIQSTDNLRGERLDYIYTGE